MKIDHSRIILESKNHLLSLRNLLSKSDIDLLNEIKFTGLRVSTQEKPMTHIKYQIGIKKYICIYTVNSCKKKQHEPRIFKLKKSQTLTTLFCREFNGDSNGNILNNFGYVLPEI
jgi:hypothetical protein